MIFRFGIFWDKNHKIPGFGVPKKSDPAATSGQRSCTVNNFCEGPTTLTRICVDYCSTYGCSDVCDQSDGDPVCKCSKENEILAPDGKTCENYICPGAGACWIYDEIAQKCRMEAGCSQLSCFSNSLKVSFDPLLFGYEKQYQWASNIKPAFNTSSSRFEFTTKLSETLVDVLFRLTPRFTKRQIGAFRPLKRKLPQCFYHKQAVTVVLSHVLLQLKTIISMTITNFTTFDF